MLYKSKFILLQTHKKVPKLIRMDRSKFRIENV